MIGMVKLRILETDSVSDDRLQTKRARSLQHFRLRGETLEAAINVGFCGREAAVDRLRCVGGSQSRHDSVLRVGDPRHHLVLLVRRAHRNWPRLRGGKHLAAR